MTSTRKIQLRILRRLSGHNVSRSRVEPRFLPRNHLVPRHQALHADMANPLGTTTLVRGTSVWTQWRRRVPWKVVRVNPQTATGGSQDTARSHALMLSKRLIHEKRLGHFFGPRIWVDWRTSGAIFFVVILSEI